MRWFLRAKSSKALLRRLMCLQPHPPRAEQWRSDPWRLIQDLQRVEESGLTFRLKVSTFLLF